jgi:hypothetical protein
MDSINKEEGIRIQCGFLLGLSSLFSNNDDGFSII